ncbi:MAG: glycine cleavage system protein GcvH [Actinomycetes bacterium]
MTYPSQLQYSRDHEWLSTDDTHGTVGITSFAAASLGDIVYVDLPAIGTIVTAGSPCGEIESTKSVSDLISPASGEVTAINDTVVSDPALINSSPYEDGWLFQLRLDDAPELMDADQYTLFANGTP